MVLSVSLSCRISPRTSTVILLGEVTGGDCGCYLSDVANLAGKVAGHEVYVVGKIFPRTTDARHLRLTAQLAFCSHFAGHARHFAGKCIELIDHRVDGVFEFENFAFHVHGDFARQIAASNGGGYLGNVAHLGGQVAGHGVDGVGEIFPGSSDTGHDRLPAQLAVGADFAGYARHFRGKRSQLIHHRVDGFFELENFAAHIHGDFAGEVAAGHGGCHLGDVSNLAGEVAGHRVDRVRQVLPGSGHARHLRLAAQFSVRSDFARHARHFGGEHAQLLNHRVDDVGGAQEFAFQRTPVHVQPYRLRQVALRDGGDRTGHLGGRTQQVFDQGVNGDFHLAPRAAGFLKAGAFARSAFFTDGLADTFQLLRHLLVGRNDVVECVGDFACNSDPGAGKACRKITLPHGFQTGQDCVHFERIALQDGGAVPVVGGNPVSILRSCVETLSLHVVFRFPSIRPVCLVERRKFRRSIALHKNKHPRLNVLGAEYSKHCRRERAVG